MSAGGLGAWPTPHHGYEGEVDVGEHRRRRPAGHRGRRHPLDLHYAALVDRQGEILATRSFATTRAGYRAMLAWMRGFGELLRVGVEQSGSFGAEGVRPSVCEVEAMCELV